MAFVDYQHTAVFKVKQLQWVYPAYFFISGLALVLPFATEESFVYLFPFLQEEHAFPDTFHHGLHGFF